MPIDARKRAARGIDRRILRALEKRDDHLPQQAPKRCVVCNARYHLRADRAGRWLCRECRTGGTR